MKCYSKRDLKVQFIELKLLRVVKYPETQKKWGLLSKKPRFLGGSKMSEQPNAR